MHSQAMLNKVMPLAMGEFFLRDYFEYPRFAMIYANHTIPSSFLFLSSFSQPMYQQPAVVYQQPVYGGQQQFYGQPQQQGMSTGMAVGAGVLGGLVIGNMLDGGDGGGDGGFFD